MVDNPLEPGERELRRATARCGSMVPMGVGELILTDKRLLWFSSTGIGNLPFSLWHPSVDIALADIDNLRVYWFLPEGPFRVKSSQGLHGFSIFATALFNPLYIWRNRQANRAFIGALRDQIANIKRQGMTPSV